MPTGSERLIQELAGRNWLILAGMALISLCWRSFAVTAGVLGGGLVVIGGFRSLHRSLIRLLQEPGRGAGMSFHFRTLVRLACLAVAIFLLIGPLKVQPLALVAGLSVVVINLMWATLQRSLV